MKRKIMMLKLKELLLEPLLMLMYLIQIEETYKKTT